MSGGKVVYYEYWTGAYYPHGVVAGRLLAGGLRRHYALTVVGTDAWEITGSIGDLM